MNYNEVLDQLRNDVRKYFTSSIDPYVSEHIVQIATSIVLHKHEIENGGGFVTAFCDNDLKNTFGRADNEIGNNIRNLVIFDYNFNADYALIQKLKGNERQR